MNELNISYVVQILGLTVCVTLASTALSAMIGLPLGYLLSMSKTPVLRRMRSVISAMTGIPPVVAGLCIYFLLTRNGPLGGFRLLYSPFAMVMAQMVIVIPIIAAVAYPSFMKVRADIHETCLGLRLPKAKIFRLLLRECRTACVSAVMTGFGRAVSEVGAVMLVGGNIAGRTRVMTTAVLTETGRGNYANAMLLGGLLLTLSLALNLFAGRFRGEHD
ncbi:MAG: ABC transporter permease [Oscillospiraceae bacterium]|nr:ABC transporter permease [Oscillospiraceae bacterium]